MKRRREIKWRRWQAVDFTQKTKQELTADEIAEVLFLLADVLMPFYNNSRILYYYFGLFFLLLKTSNQKLSLTF